MNLKSNLLLTKVPPWNAGCVKTNDQHLKGQAMGQPGEDAYEPLLDRHDGARTMGQGQKLRSTQAQRLTGQWAPDA